jgi:hypothetical protein
VAFEDIKAELDLLLTRLAGQPEDEHELHELIRERLGQIRAMGMPLPDDLVELEQELSEDEAAAGSEPVIER